MDINTENGKTVVNKEKKAIISLEKRFADKKFSRNFSRTVEMIYNCKGKVVVTGIGKSGIIAQKIVSTFNSTGTYSIFLHSADSIHGDVGIIRKEDIALIISKSGDTSEIRPLLPIFRDFGIKIILITSNADSYLARNADILLDFEITTEACPYNLAPTSSTTAALVLGDALAIALLQRRGFSKEDFAMFHPGGALGKRLLLKVNDVMAKGNELPVVNENDNMKKALYIISNKRLGCAIVMNKNKITGIITDGDLRRALQKNNNISELCAKDIMSPNPKMISKDTFAVNALEIMENNKITQLIISNDKKKPDGIIHIHTLVELGLK
jgi:arabinose-5-phosphate isomerase